MQKPVRKKESLEVIFEIIFYYKRRYHKSCLQLARLENKLKPKARQEREECLPTHRPKALQAQQSFERTETFAFGIGKETFLFPFFLGKETTAAI